MERNARSVCERGLEQENAMPRHCRGLINCHPASLPWDGKSKNRDGFGSSSLRRFPITKPLMTFFPLPPFLTPCHPRIYKRCLLQICIWHGWEVFSVDKQMNVFYYIVKGLSLNIVWGNTNWFPTGAVKRQTDRQTDRFSLQEHHPIENTTQLFPFV